MGQYLEAWGGPQTKPLGKTCGRRPKSPMNSGDGDMTLNRREGENQEKRDENEIENRINYPRSKELVKILSGSNSCGGGDASTISYISNTTNYLKLCSVSLQSKSEPLFSLSKMKRTCLPSYICKMQQ